MLIFISIISFILLVAYSYFYICLALYMRKVSREAQKEANDNYEKLIRK